MERLLLYDGMLVPAEKVSPIPKTESLQILNARYLRDGLEDGLTLGASIKMRAYAREKAVDGCVTIVDALAAARNQINSEGLSSNDASNFPKKLLGDEETEAEKKEGKLKVGLLEAAYQQLVEYHLAAAWMGPALFEKHMGVEAEAYKNHLRAHINKRKFVDEREKEPLDEGALERVEKQIDITSASQAEIWRNEFSGFVSPRERRGENVHYSEMPRFEEALVKRCSLEPLGELRIAFDLLATDKPRDPEKERKKREALAKNLQHERLGYRACCVRKLLGEGPGTGYLRKRLYKK
jgi:hypothetical protein